MTENPRPGERRRLIRERPIFVIMTKAPVCGVGKTRLSKDIGPVAAGALTRALTAALLRQAMPDPRFQTILAISPEGGASARFSAWSIRHSKTRPPRLNSRARTERPPLKGRFPRAIGTGTCLRVSQGAGGLGARMQRIFGQCGRGPLIIVGSDIPFITRETIALAFTKLRRADAIFGPAEDGGYWLAGLRRIPKCLVPFENVRWSSPHALADTLKNLRKRRIAFAATLFDIDTLADYRRYRQTSATR